MAERFRVSVVRPSRRWRMSDGRFHCAGCGHRTLATAGTIFDRTRTLFTLWFMACWMFATRKDGVSAQSLQRFLEIGVSDQGNLSSAIIEIRHGVGVSVGGW